MSRIPGPDTPDSLELRTNFLKPMRRWWAAKTTTFWLLRFVVLLVVLPFGLFVIVTQSIQLIESADPNHLRERLVILVAGIGAVVSGVGVWSLKRWGWWTAFLIVGLASILGVDFAIWGGPGLCLAFTATLFFDFQEVISPEVDRVAQALGVHWSRTPLPSIDNLVRAGSTLDARSQYREVFGCSPKEAQAAIRFWHCDTTSRKLRYLAKVMLDKPGTDSSTTV